MTSPKLSQVSLVLSRSTKGAEAAARLVHNDAISIVDKELSEKTVTAVSAHQYSEVLVECATQEPSWLAGMLHLVRTVSSPATTVTLVVSDGQMGSDLTPAVGEALGGWRVRGVGIEDDILFLKISASDEAVESANTIASLQGALLLEQAFRVVRDPMSHDLAEFEYRASQLTLYLREIPSLHAEIETLGNQVRQLQQANEQLGKSLEAERASASVARAPSTPDELKGRPLEPKPVAKSRWSRRRMTRLTAVTTAGLIWVTLSALAASRWDLGSNGFLTLLVLGTVIGLGLDLRRRSKTLLASTRSAATVSIIRRYQRQLARFVEAQMELVMDAVRSHSDQADTRMATGLAAAREQWANGVAASRELIATELTSTRRIVEAALGDFGGQIEAISKATTSASDMRSLLRAELLVSYRQLEANMRLRDLVKDRGATPQLRGWAASPDVIVLLIHELRRIDAEIFVDCGSGASTVWLALAAKSANLRTRVISLEHQPAFAHATTQLLKDCGVDDIAEVRLAPLEKTSIGDAPDGWRWYAHTALDDLRNVGLVFVDGPPGESGSHARYPALPILRPLLAPNAVVVLDDTIRAHEKEICERWVAEFPEFQVQFHDFEKGAAVFRLGDAPNGQ